MNKKYEKLLEYLAVARANEKMHSSRSCDDCGSHLIQREGRCMTCRACGWSACG